MNTKSVILLLALITLLSSTNAQDVKSDSIYQWKQNTKGYFGLTLNVKGKETTILPYEYDIVKELNNNLYAVYSSTAYKFKWAFFHKRSLDFVTPFIYNSYEIIQDGYVAVQLSNFKWGILDNNGLEICQPKFDKIRNASNGQRLALAQLDNKYGFITKEGHIAIPFEYDETFGFLEENSPYTVVIKNKKCGVIDNEGKSIIPLKYDFLAFNKDFISNRISADTLMAGSNGGHGFIKIDETIIVPMVYDFLKWPSEGLIAAAKKGSKYGFINFSNETVVPFIYEDVRPFSEGLAAVHNGSYWGFIDRKGEVVIPAKYDNVTNFDKGKSLVEQGEKSFYIDKKGRFLLKNKM